MSRPTCSTCRHYRPGAPGEFLVESDGECRLYPPSIEYRGGWPIANADAWCGQHRRPPLWWGEGDMTAATIGTLVDCSTCSTTYVLTDAGEWIACDGSRNTSAQQIVCPSCQQKARKEDAA